MKLQVQCAKALNNPYILDVAIKYASCLVNDFSETHHLETYKFKVNCNSSNLNEVFYFNSTNSNGYYSLHLNLFENDVQKNEDYPIFTGSFYASQTKLGTLSPEFAWHFFLNIGQIVVRMIFIIIWSILCVKNRKSLLHIQILFGVVLLLGFIENVSFIYSYNNLINNISINMRFCFVLSSIHVIALHYLLIIIAMGFGVTRAFGGRHLKWTIIAILIFAACHLFRAFIPIDYSPPINVSKLELFSTMLTIFIEVILIFWFIFLMKTTIQEIRIRKTTGKLKPYNWMTVITIIALLLSATYIVTTTLFSRIKGTKTCRYVQDMSIDNAVWCIILTFVEISLFFIWIPSENNNKLSDGVIVDFTDDLYNFYNPCSISKEDKDSYALYERSDATFENSKFRRFKGLQDDTSSVNDTDNVVRDSVKLIQNNKFDPNKDDPLKWIEDNVPTVSAKDPTLILNDAEVIYEKNSAISKIQ